jgi:hypothetical protein
MRSDILGFTFCMILSGVASAQEAPAAQANPAPATPTAAAAAPDQVLSVQPDETDAAKIMKAVESKPRADRTKGQMVLSIKDRTGRTRERAVRSWAIDVDGAQRQLIVFDKPADVSGTSLLSIDYDDTSRDDDQWLFLPSLKKTTRISSGDRSGSFMGTDLSYADMTRSDTSQYDYTILKQSVTVAGEECWLLEARPRTQKAKDETGYVKVNMWVSKAKLLTLQIKAWVREGRKLKYIKFDEFKMLGGQWTAQKISARTVRGRKVQSTTVIQFLDMTADNPDVKPTLFDQNSQWWTR